MIKLSGMDRCLTTRFNLERGPSDDWFKRFQSRHPDLKWAVPQTIDVRRTYQSTEYIIDDFFNKLGKLLQEIKDCEEYNFF